MTVTVASFKTFFTPTFDDVDDGVLQPRIDEAERRTNRTAWGDKADDGVCYLAAHLHVVRAGLSTTASAAKGDVISETMGPVSRNYAATTPLPFSTQWFALSTYGQLYVGLRGECFASRVCA